MSCTQGLAIGRSTRLFLKQLSDQDGPPLYDLPVDAARAVLSGIQHTSNHGSAAKLLLPGRRVRIRARGVAVTVSVFLPRGRPKGRSLPAMVYMHGGGWILGDRLTHARLVRTLCEATRSVVVFVEYDRAPEAQWPTQLFQCSAAVQWTMGSRARRLGVDPHRVALIGDSVGGNLATVTAMVMGVSGCLPCPLVAQVLLYPVTNGTCFETQSYHQFRQGPWLTRRAMQWFWDAYLPQQSKRDSITASPLLAPLNVLARMPPTLVMTNEYDVLRDEGEAYAGKLREAGVPTEAFRTLGTIHDSLLLEPLVDSPSVKGALEVVTRFLVKVLWPDMHEES